MPLEQKDQVAKTERNKKVVIAVLSVAIAAYAAYFLYKRYFGSGTPNATSDGSPSSGGNNNNNSDDNTPSSPATSILNFTVATNATNNLVFEARLGPTPVTIASAVLNIVDSNNKVLTSINAPSSSFVTPSYLQLAIPVSQVSSTANGFQLLVTDSKGVKYTSQSLPLSSIQPSITSLASTNYSISPGASVTISWQTSFAQSAQLVSQSTITGQTQILYSSDPSSNPYTSTGSVSYSPQNSDLYVVTLNVWSDPTGNETNPTAPDAQSSIEIFVSSDSDVAQVYNFTVQSIPPKIDTSQFTQEQPLVFDYIVSPSTSYVHMTITSEDSSPVVLIDTANPSSAVCPDAPVSSSTCVMPAMTLSPAVAEGTEYTATVEAGMSAADPNLSSTSLQFMVGQGETRLNEFQMLGNVAYWSFVNARWGEILKYDPNVNGGTPSTFADFKTLSTYNNVFDSSANAVPNCSNNAICSLTLFLSPNSLSTDTSPSPPLVQSVVYYQNA